MLRKTMIAGVLGVVSLGMVSAALAEWQPKKPVEFVIMAGKGGGADKMARLMQTVIEKHDLAGKPIEFEHRMDMSDPKIAGLRFTCRQIVQGMDGRDDFPHIPSLHTNVVDFLISGLLHAQPHNYTAILTKPSLPIEPRYIRKVEEYIRAHAHETLRVPELALHFGLNVRVLQAGFKKNRNYS